MKEKARDLIYLNTNRYISFPDLKKFRLMGLFFSFLMLVMGVSALQTRGFGWKSLFPIVCAVVWSFLYCKFVYEIKSRKTTFEMRFFVNGMFGVFMTALIWMCGTSLILVTDKPMVDFGFCLLMVLLYLIFSVSYVGLIVLGVHKGSFRKVRKFGSSAKVLAVDALLASSIPLLVVCGMFNSKRILAEASVSAQNTHIIICWMLLILLLALCHINFVQYYYCKKYGIDCDEYGNKTSHKLE